MTESTLEQQIAELQQQLQAKRAESGQDASAPYERQEVHGAIGEQVQQAQSENAGQAQQAPVVDSGQNASAAVDPLDDPVLVEQVQSFVNIAFTKSVQEAIGQAVKTGNPALVDALHDILADQMHEELIKRQKLEPAK